MRLKEPSEKSIQNSILSYLKARGVLAWENKTTGVWDTKKQVFRQSMSIHRKVGVSDILGIYRCRFLAIEVKSKRGKPSLPQLQFLDEIVKAGGIAFIAKSVEEVQDVLKKADVIINKSLPIEIPEVLNGTHEPH